MEMCCLFLAGGHHPLMVLQGVALLSMCNIGSTGE